MPKKYIDLDEALELFDADMNFYNWNGEVIGKLAHVSAFQKTAREKLLSLPLADVVERKKGKWIITDIDIINRVWHCNCSECGEDPIHFISGSEDWWLNKLPKFCPYCGADMREEKTNG